ncbi:MAG: hypothetical protein UY70_C0005G0035 [Candidatus Kaiserbacteria bacterium GW2011_GWB1_52_6]|uniref:VWFA domain-containing protein n=3 Tax=Candidatus Kaiseribacteriota TaxID=1752734 RepID=A0A0G1XL35_9BACT|nr:MAG: hypothetical protein UY67_C0004G0030 [Candidatus Kaiserbacteria bacterium GW2011_GWA2_52_12]KKW27971.1 MAG: hypothetical protein UY70_C0005G0035 [Candidatus Kaiserbacteria bacterium GW2011_GWB1_52_6]KKW31988.1 MAG: hypothetical protein UY74_C0002G0024 [Candidatus Kaiserbacteria bacterium GW2011_GWC2_52_8b]
MIEIWKMVEKNKGPRDANPDTTPTSEEEMRAFFEEDRDFLRAYIGDDSIGIEPAPPGSSVKTLGIDLEKGKMYVNPDFFMQMKHSKKPYVLFHEFEHFRELRDLLAEKSGDKVWRKHRDKVQVSKRYSILDNTWDDVRMNRGVDSRAPALKDAKEALYKEDLFPETDFTKLPKHLQFAYTLLRERMVPNEACTVAPDVRAEIDRLRGIKSKSGVPLLEYASRPDIPPSVRIALQDKYLDPVSKRFFDEDVEQKKKDQQQQGDQGQGEGTGEDDPKSGKDPKKQQAANGAGQKPEKGQKGKGKNSEDQFKNEYAEYNEKNPDKALPAEDIDKAVKKYIEAKQKTGTEKTEEEMLQEAYAREAGVSVEDLRTYQNFWSEVENIQNPETNERVLEELRAIFRKIIAERMAPRLRPKLPTTEGEILARPADAVAAIKAGIQEPAVWETVEVHEKLLERFGNFDVTLVGDRSGSMQESDSDGAVKNVEQRKAIALTLEALTEFSRELDDVHRDLLYDLHVRTESWAFGGDKEIGILKPLSETLTEKERVAVYKTLGDTHGDETKDFKALERIKDSIPEEDWQRIADKKLRKIIIVLSDGNSSDQTAAQKAAKELRDRGVIVVGVGITKSGAAITTTYAPDGRVCEKAGQLGTTLGNLLKEHLKDL